MNAPTKQTHEPPRPGLARDIGLHGEVALSWTMAGGILLGGFLVGGMTLAGRLSAHGLFMTSTGLFAVGALLGFVHGSVLGYFGRAEGVARDRALGDVALATLYALPGLAIAWLATVWIAMSVVAAYVGRVGPLLGAGLGWAVGLTVVGWSAWEGLRALRNAYARWPERRAGTLIVAATFAGLLVLFLADRPMIWGLELRLTETGAVLLAAAAALWIAGPMVTLGLRLLGGMPRRAPRAGVAPTPGGLADVVIGLAVGVALGLLAAPFAAPAAGAAVGGGGAIVVAVSRALVDEVLLRLFLLTGTVWLLMRWHRVHPEEAAIVGVLVAATAQVLLYAPGIVALGFPSLTGAAGFAVAAVLLPALAFGALYWLRGFTTAVVADATAVAALALLLL